MLVKPPATHRVITHKGVGTEQQRHWVPTIGGQSSGLLIEWQFIKLPTQDGLNGAVRPWRRWIHGENTLRAGKRSAGSRAAAPQMQWRAWRQPLLVANHLGKRGGRLSVTSAAQLLQAG